MSIWNAWLVCVRLPCFSFIIAPILAGCVEDAMVMYSLMADNGSAGGKVPPLVLPTLNKNSGPFPLEGLKMGLYSQVNNPVCSNKSISSFLLWCLKAHYKCSMVYQSDICWDWVYCISIRNFGARNHKQWVPVAMQRSWIMIADIEYKAPLSKLISWELYSPILHRASDF